MNSLTVEEIVKYAIRIEEESYNFYKKASKIIKEGNLTSLVLELADQELNHLNQLNNLLDDKSQLSEILISIP